jgi:hypothetical protein
MSNENAAENPEDSQAAMQSKADKGPEQRYELYVRVPPAHDDSLGEVRGFLQELAELLTNAGHDIEVLPYDDAKEAYIAKPAGDRASPLYPLYVCHNKY